MEIQVKPKLYTGYIFWSSSKNQWNITRTKNINNIFGCFLHFFHVSASENAVQPKKTFFEQNNYHLVGGFNPSEKVAVSWDYYSRYMEKYVFCSKPPTSHDSSLDFEDPSCEINPFETSKIQISTISMVQGTKVQLGPSTRSDSHYLHLDPGLTPLQNAEWLALSDDEKSQPIWLFNIAMVQMAHLQMFTY